LGDLTHNLACFTLVIDTSQHLTGMDAVKCSKKQKPDIKEMIESSICYVGRVFVCERNCRNARTTTSLKNCRGTVGLVGSGGESIGCWHTIEDAMNRPGKYRMFIDYPNYPRPLTFEARIKDSLISSSLDLFVAEPIERLQHETLHLKCALDVSLADVVHYFGFPKIVDDQIAQRNRKMKRSSHQEIELQRSLKSPTIFTGRVCFKGWKQAVADYRCFPNSSGGIVIDDYGCLKGIHVAGVKVERKFQFRNFRMQTTPKKSKYSQSSSCTTADYYQKTCGGELEPYLEKLCDQMSSFSTRTAAFLNSLHRNQVATFVPVQIFEEPLHLARLRLIRWKEPACPAPHRVSQIKTKTPQPLPLVQDLPECSHPLRKSKRPIEQLSENPLIWF
jgi:hypothetical protein